MGEPVLVALLIADRVIEEKNGKKGIIGTFTTFNSPSFPVSFPPWFIYAAVTNLAGEHDFALNLAHARTSQIVVGISGKFNAASAEQVVELVIPVPKAVFPSEGKYDLTFQVDSTPLGARVLSVVPAKT
jgi:hypothetical protein